MLAGTELAAQAQVIHVRVMGRLGSAYEVAQLCAQAMVMNLNCAEAGDQNDMIEKLAGIVAQHHQGLGAVQ